MWRRRESARGNGEHNFCEGGIPAKLTGVHAGDFKCVVAMPCKMAVLTLLPGKHELVAIPQQKFRPVSTFCPKDD